MTSTSTAMPNTVELIHRLHRVARTVVSLVDRAEISPTEEHQGRAVVALALWSMMTGIDNDDARAISYARRVAQQDWPAQYLAAP